MGTNPFLRVPPKPIAQRLPNRHADTSESSTADVLGECELTPLRAHYLKKTLVSLQLQRELALAMQGDVLGQLGPPFKQTPNAPQVDLPFLRHFLHKFVLTFPFFVRAPPDFFSTKVQAFVERLVAHKIVVIDEATGDSARLPNILSRFERYACLLMSSALHVPGGEEVVHITEEDRQKIVSMEKHRFAAQNAVLNQHAAEALSVNIASVRTIRDRGMLRSREHDEFILCTHTNNGEQVFVARRYCDFQNLHLTLRATLPANEIPGPPPKDRTATTVSQAVRHDSPTVLPRERNRLTLRAYMHGLMGVPSVADSDAMRDFLLKNPITLTAQEKADAEARRRADTIREEERARFASDTAVRVQELRKHIGDFKAELMQPDGLSHMFSIIRQCPRASDLPPRFRVMLDWAESSMAAGLFSMFVGSDTASQSFANLKLIHGMMPYFMIRSILRISNPLAMIRSLLDLFLVQPFGQKSLLQRMFTGQLQEEINELSAMGKGVQAKVQDMTLIQKMDEFVALPWEAQNALAKQAAQERIDLVTAIMRSPIGCDLQRLQVHRIVLASRAYEQFKRRRSAAEACGSEQVQPDNDDAWLYEDLHVYLNLTRTIRDKEQLIALVFDSATTELAKDMITIFYAPLAQVYKAANIADTLSDAQNFITDLIRTVEENVDLNASNPRYTVQVFNDLVRRHERLFYNFVYQVQSKGSDLFDSLARWIELFVNYVRDPAQSSEATSEGLGTVDLASCLPDGAQQAKVLNEVDEIIKHTYQRKLKRELKMQRRLSKAEISGAAEAYAARREKADEDAFVQAMSDEFGFGAMFGQVADVAAEESEESSMDAVSDSDSDDPGNVDHAMHKVKAEAPQAASTDAILALLPAFMALVRPTLRDPV
ncbi:hypothetical protein MVES1_004005 [Malassezia vespertilionis]|uniref:PX domain-containing protein n=1 Tax=Malassezia vespertilionis TaxID=2020962 RepID=A0A2N1J839_9BASI|nr:uncharacterized protein MVES1_004005 [Malassezia vespertilionis]PKI82726.1 hypothetical protein MVES_003553 [Malassezia vespertilionis]WFD08628.1 hypothetical protein MVES1_004005 [Malassezia vespertilionis]